MRQSVHFTSDSHKCGILRNGAHLCCCARIYDINNKKRNPTASEKCSHSIISLSLSLLPVYFAVLQIATVQLFHLLSSFNCQQSYSIRCCYFFPLLSHPNAFTVTMKISEKINIWHSRCLFHATKMPLIFFEKSFFFVAIASVKLNTNNLSIFSNYSSTFPTTLSSVQSFPSLNYYIAIFI